MEDTGRGAPLSPEGSGPQAGLKDAARKIARVLVIVLPVAFATAVLGRLGVLAFLDASLGPLTRPIGLPGAALLALAASIFFDIYGAAAAAIMLSLNVREAAILSIICLTAHNLVAETRAMRRSGSPGAKMVFLRIVLGIGSGWAFSVLLPPSLASRTFGRAVSAAPDLRVDALGWAAQAGGAAARILVVVMAVMALRAILERLKGMEILARILAPLMRFIGLSSDSSLFWAVANIVGYDRAADIVVGEIEGGRMKRQEGDLLNHNAAFCHSLLEDSAIFVSFGLPIFWVVVPRIALAAAVVWIERIRRHYVRRSFRAGVA